MREFVVAVDDIQRSWHPPKLRFPVGGPHWFRSAIDCCMSVLLRWTRAESEAVVTTRVFQRASAGTLFERMHLNARDLRRLYNQEARYLFVGPDVMTELANECVPLMGLGQLGARLGGPGGIRNVLGVEVVYVPWMSGVLLVHDWQRSIPQEQTK